jgi:integrase
LTCPSLAGFEVPTDIKFKPPHVITPDHFKSLLDRCVSMNHLNRMTVLVLVGFCGIRIEEASKLDWSHLDLNRGTVLVPADVAKKAGFRINKIPTNAMDWLQLTSSPKRNGKLISENWRTLIRSSIRFSKINYRQNCIRHSFCSYAIGAGWPLADVIASMGHGGSPSMIFSHYRNVVSEEDGKRWFSILP